MTLHNVEEFMKHLVFEAGKTIMPFFRRSVHIQDKSLHTEKVFDPVTEADKAAEKIIRNLIEKHYPDHGILGEEYGETSSQAEYLWVIDPIDGTRAFISGLPTWGILIGLLYNGKPVAGIMYQPFTEELYYGDSHLANLLHKETCYPLSVRSCDTLKQATLSTTSPFLFDEQHFKRFRAVEKEVRMSRYGCDCYAYCMVAAGHMDLVIESDLKPYDIAALIPIIEGAGGIITNWDGKSAVSGGDIVASGDRRIHEQALTLLQSI